MEKVGFICTAVDSIRFVTKGNKEKISKLIYIVGVKWVRIDNIICDVPLEKRFNPDYCLKLIFGEK